MKSSLLFFSLCFLCLCISLLPSFSTSTILFQGFVWASSEQEGGWWNHLKPLVGEIAASGAEYVWLPPPSNADVNGSQGYLPKRLYDLDTSKYGNKEELKSLVAAFKQSGVKAVSDIVINHRMPERFDSNGNSIFEGGTPDSRLDWGVAEICRDDPEFHGTGNPDTGIGWGQVPDIDHTSTRVQQELSDWMNWLKTEVGFSGWRFDMVLGYAPKFTKLYIDNTKPEFSVGELFEKVALGNDNKPLANQDAHRGKLVNWVNEVGSGVLTFDFTTKMILGAAVEGELWRLKDGNGKPPGMIGTKPESAVTLVDNHDTGSQKTYPFPEDKIMLGYVYILTHPGHPSIFYHDYFERQSGIKDNIKSLSAIRKRNGITATSSINILAAQADLYMANIANKIIVKIGPNENLGNLLPSNAQVVANGQDYAVWELK
ncbi:alpha-amylase-like [Arachis stenosperma]|uniref:alpha-amylase-like n=1 Tax=Arachis stenosperma TaxID=217475 RepID=UPI0025ACC0C6|nr:alpha-amylase-like [Arachis stenosperma]